jgi:hypothetical protein
MYQMIKKLVRPNLETEWPDSKILTPVEHVEHFSKNYIDTGKQIFRNIEDDTTGLERTVTVLWESKEIWEEFNADPVMQSMRDTNSQRLQSLGITEEVVSLSEI